MRKNSEKTPSLELHTHTDDFYDSTLVWVCAETCAPYLKDVAQLQYALNELGYEGIALFDEDPQDREDVTSCIEIVESFSQPISQLLHKLNLDGNTVIFLSADEDAALLGTHISDFKIPFDNADVHGTIVHCNPLYTRLNHNSYGLQRETLITIAHELGHAYMGDIYDEDGDLVEAEDHHGPDEEEVEAFGREWVDLVLGNASEVEIDAVISKFKADIERLKLAIESGEIDPYRSRPNPSREWFETQSLQNDENGFLVNPDTNDIYWYHGNRHGVCGADWSYSGHRYLSSSFETAHNFINEEPITDNYRCVICEYTVQIPASQIYDARKTQDGTINPDQIEDLDYNRYDYNQDTVYELGDYKGFLEVESLHPPTPVSLGIHLSHNHLLRVTREIEYCPDCVQAEVIDHGDFRECPKCSFKIKDCDSCSGWVEVGESCPWCG